MKYDRVPSVTEVAIKCLGLFCAVGLAAILFWYALRPALRTEGAPAFLAFLLAIAVGGWLAFLWTRCCPYHAGGFAPCPRQWPWSTLGGPRRCCRDRAR